MVSNSAMGFALVAGEVVSVTGKNRATAAVQRGGLGSAALECSEKGTGMGRWGKSGVPSVVHSEGRFHEAALRVPSVTSQENQSMSLDTVRL